MVRTFRVPLAVILLALGALVLAACGGDDDDGDQTPTTSANETSTATVETGTYPVQVTDLLGREVEFAQQPERIVALSPTAAEFVYALGHEVVGRASSVDYPEAALEAQEIGTAYQPNLEAIVSLNPDLIVADHIVQAQPALRDSLEGLPAPVVFVGVESYDDVLEGLRILGQVLDANDEAAAVVDEVEEARDSARSALDGKDISAVVLISDRDQTLYAAKAGSYVGDLLEQLGITNPASEQPDSGPFPGYTTLSPEKLIEYNPDYILTITPAPPPAPRLSDILGQIPAFRGLTAVSQGQVVEADVDLFLQAPGPRIIQAFEAILSAVSGDDGQPSGG